MYANTCTLAHTCNKCIHSHPKRSNLWNPTVYICICTFTQTHVHFVHTIYTNTYTQEIQSMKPHWTCVYICLHVHIHICTFTQYIQIHVHFHTRAIYAYIRIPRDPIFKTPLYINIYISTCAYINIYMCIYKYLYAHIMYANTCTLPHTCHICIHSHFLCIYAHATYWRLVPRDPIYETPLYMCIFISTCTYIYVSVQTMYANICTHMPYIHTFASVGVRMHTPHARDTYIYIRVYPHRRSPKLQVSFRKRATWLHVGSHTMWQATNVAGLFP